MPTYEEALMKIYWKLWTSADFESDFQRDWKELYNILHEGNHYRFIMQDIIIKMAFQYLQDWENKEGK